MRILEIASPFAPGIAYHAELVGIDSAFGAAAARADLAAFEDGHAWFLDPATSILLEYAPTGDGSTPFARRSQPSLPNSVPSGEPRERMVQPKFGSPNLR